MKKDFQTIIGVIGSLATSQNNSNANKGKVSQMAETLVDAILKKEPIRNVQDFDTASAVIGMIRKVASQLDDMVR